MTSPAPATGAPPRNAFRPDVEGLRAVAVLSVLAYHAGLPVVTGGFAGVDVFFVLSGFLITGQLLREVGSTGTVDLPAFYGRRFKRLLPAATTVLVFTVIASWLVLPSTRLREVWGDVAASALYVVNWRLADRSTDYLAEDALPSPVQHYWSLAVEEQFYVIWPLVLLVVGWTVTRSRLPLGVVATGALLLIALPSLAWSAWLTHTSPETAYFVTTTRLWELAVGGLVACGGPLWQRLDPRAGAALLLGGLATLLVTFVLVDSATPWPGLAALAPTLGTAACVVGGATAQGLPVRVLASAPMVWIGGLSYSLYLWHWPLVLLTDQGLFDGEAPLWATLGAAAASFPLAWVGHHVIENPVRFHPLFKRTRPALALGASLTGVAALGSLLLVSTLPSAKVADLSATGTWGAQRLLPDQDAATVPATVEPVVTAGAVVDDPASITPLPEAATEDLPPGYAEGCQVSLEGTEPVQCVYGDRESDQVVALVGDSKARQWLPAVDRWASARGYRVVTLTKSSCTWADALLADFNGYTACRTWGKAATEQLAELEPDILLVSGASRFGLDGPDDAEREVSTLADGYARNWRPHLARGAKVVAILDTPTPPSPVYECVAEHRHDVTACDFPFAEAKGTPPLKAAVQQVDQAELVDFTDFLCPEGVCHAVVGEVLTYRQGAHVTATWVKSLQPVFDARLDTALASS